MEPHALRQLHLAPEPGPKRILSLDGGGVRGILSLGYLEEIEKMLRLRYQRDVKLSDYFSLIGGTSTGSLIATALALGFSVEELIHIYKTVSRRTFVSRAWRGFRWMERWAFPKFDEKALEATIFEYLKEHTLGSERFHCGLGIVAKRLDTGKVWIFHNHPEGPYYECREPLRFTANKDLPIVKLLRASTAAPTFFAPNEIEIAPGRKGMFIDGGMSPHGNPALLLFMLATIQGYGFRWPMGDDRLMLVSVGTGSTPPEPPSQRGSRGPKPTLLFGIESLTSLMDDGSQLARAMLQWMSESPTAEKIDGEIGTLKGELLAGRPLLHYIRYNTVLERDPLKKLGFDFSEKQVKLLREMDRPESVDDLLEIGRRAAVHEVAAGHFPAAFDLPAAQMA